MRWSATIQLSIRASCFAVDTVEEEQTMKTRVDGRAKCRALQSVVISVYGLKSGGRGDRQRSAKIRERERTKIMRYTVDIKNVGILPPLLEVVPDAGFPTVRRRDQVAS